MCNYYIHILTVFLMSEVIHSYLHTHKSSGIMSKITTQPFSDFYNKIEAY